MNGVPTGKILFSIFLVIMAMVVVFIVGTLQGGGGSAPTTEQPSTPTIIVTPAKAPKEYLPAAVAGFEVATKTDQVTPAFGEESASAISFKPSAGSMFENKVRHLTFYAHLFSNTEKATSMANRLTANAIVLEYEISGKKASLTYKKETGQATMSVQIDRTVIYCFAEPPAGATTFDGQTLQNAVMMGFMSIKF